MTDTHGDKKRDGLRIAHQVGNGGLSRENAVLLAEAFCELWDELDVLRSTRSAAVPPLKPIAWRYRYGKNGSWRLADTNDDCNPGGNYEIEPLYSAQTVSALVPMVAQSASERTDTERMDFMERFIVEGTWADGVAEGKAAWLADVECLRETIDAALNVTNNATDSRAQDNPAT